ncbi:MAG: hypothetical protein U0324_07230 [Polyangiales bacterium]
MPFNEFTVHDLTHRIGLRYVESPDLFGGVAAVAPGEVLTAVLRENAPVALAVSTEKARSELLIAPILMEARRLCHGAVSFFSGAELNVDAARGLNGFCDYVLARSPTQTELDAPLVTIVEAKNENLRAGLPQCAAEMYAAKLFNERRERPTDAVYGAVTTGNVWRFLRLRGGTVEVDLREYYLDAVERVLGVLVHMLTRDGAAA